jgi:putative aldouronate transport system substrate-binding protein
LTFPDTNPNIYRQKPGASKDFTALIIASRGTPPPVAKNKYWQAINEALGAELKAVMAPPNDYLAKFNSAVASGDLPDVALLLPTTPRLPQVVTAEFQDLTEFVSGDAVHKYQGLANIATQQWKSALVGGRIYGVPQPRNSIAPIFTARSDIAAQRGLDPTVKSASDLLALCRGLTDVKKGEWASDLPDTMVTFVQEMLEGPNVWRQTDGEFESQYTSEEYRRALQFTASMWKEGLFNPDAYTLNNTQLLADIEGGKTFTTLSNDYGVYVARNTVGADYHLAPSLPPKFDGGGAARQYLTSGIYGLTVLKKASASRVEEMLRVVDWFTAPFGTQEYLLAQWGVKGWDYTENDGSLVITPTGTVETSLKVAYIGYAPPPVYVPEHPQVTRDIYDYGQQVMPTAVLPANVGLYSDTDQSQGQVIAKALLSAQRDVITGRKTLSDWDNAVTAWQKAGGDQIKSEYEQAWAQQNR